MNKQYKVIWSKVKNSYVVVSELAKRSGKAVSIKSQPAQTLAAVLTVLALSMGVTGLASAAANTEGTGAGVAVGTSSEATTYMAAAIGNSAKATGSASTALGYNTTASGNNTVAIGSSAAASNTSAISIGNRSK